MSTSHSYQTHPSGSSPGTPSKSSTSTPRLPTLTMDKAHSLANILQSDFKKIITELGSHKKLTAVTLRTGVVVDIRQAVEQATITLKLVTAPSTTPTKAESIFCRDVLLHPLTGLALARISSLTLLALTALQHLLEYHPTAPTIIAVVSILRQVLNDNTDDQVSIKSLQTLLLCITSRTVTIPSVLEQTYSVALGLCYKLLGAYNPTPSTLSGAGYLANISSIATSGAMGFGGGHSASAKVVRSTAYVALRQLLQGKVEILININKY